MHEVKQNTTIGFYALMVDSSDKATGTAGLTLAVTLSKSGGAFSAVAPTVTDRGDGWYWIEPIAAHRDTLGQIAWHITADGVDAVDLVENVVAVDNQVAAYGSAIAGDAMSLTPGERDTVAGVVDSRLLDAGDATDLIASIVSRIGNTNVDSVALVGLIRADLERASGVLDTISSAATEARLSTLDNLDDFKADVSSIEIDTASVTVNLSTSQAMILTDNNCEGDETLEAFIGSTWNLQFRSLGSLADAEGLEWQLKKRATDADSKAFAKIVLTIPDGGGDGLTWLNGSAAGDATLAEIEIIDSANGDVDVTVHTTATVLASIHKYHHSLAKIDTATTTPDTKTRIAEGFLKVKA